MALPPLASSKSLGGGRGNVAGESFGAPAICVESDILFKSLTYNLCCSLVEKLIHFEPRAGPKYKIITIVGQYLSIPARMVSVR